MIRTALIDAGHDIEAEPVDIEALGAFEVGDPDGDIADAGNHAVGPVLVALSDCETSLWASLRTSRAGRAPAYAMSPTSGHPKPVYITLRGLTRGGSASWIVQGR